MVASFAPYSFGGFRVQALDELRRRKALVPGEIVEDTPERSLEPEAGRMAAEADRSADGAKILGVAAWSGVCTWLVLEHSFHV